jgi:hypothetical protein
MENRTQAVNRQISKDWRLVDLTATDYTAEVTGGFIIVAEDDCTIALRNTVNNTTNIMTIPAWKEICFQTDTVYRIGTDAGVVIWAIY